MTEESKENMPFKQFIKELFRICWKAPKEAKRDYYFVYAV